MQGSEWKKLKNKAAWIYLIAKLPKCVQRQSSSNASSTGERTYHYITWTTHLSSQVNWPRQTDCEPTVLSQSFGHWFCHGDFVAKWGFGQDGSGDNKICLWWLLFSANQRHSVHGQFLRGQLVHKQLSWTRIYGVKVLYFRFKLN